MYRAVYNILPFRLKGSEYIERDILIKTDQFMIKQSVKGLQ